MQIIIKTKEIITLFLFISQIILAQTEKKIDGIAAVIGDEIILDSDIEEEYKRAIAEGIKVGNKCEFMDNILINKLILSKAKSDTLVTVSDSRVEQESEARIEQFMRQAGSENELLKAFNKKSMAELKIDLKQAIKDNQYVQEKMKLISGKVDVSPVEMQEFFSLYEKELPDVAEEVELAHLTLYPKLTDEHKQEYIDKLNKIKKEIESGESFASKARIYTDDPGSKEKGGEYLNVKRGQMVKEFEAVAFNLEEGQISEPFETEYGFHIVQLDKRKGQLLDLKHILIKTTPNKKEIETTEKKLDSLRTLLVEGKMTFKEAVFKFSDDKASRFNGGVLTHPRTGEGRWEKLELSSKLYYNIASVKENELSRVFEDTQESDGRKVVRIVKLLKTIPAHKMDLSTDYYRIKQMAISGKKNKIIEKWVKAEIPESYIKIDNEYNKCNFSYDWMRNSELTNIK